MDIGNTGKVKRVVIDDTPVEFRDIMITPEVTTSAQVTLRKGMNLPALAHAQYGNADDWWKILADSPDIMYPLDVDKHSGRKVKL